MSHTTSIIEAGDVRQLADRYAPRIREIRRYIHRRPELSGHEQQTTEFLSQVVKDLGLEPTIAPDDRGLFVDLGGNETSTRIAIRADIDALPIHSQLEVDYASVHENVMHACGHDAHAAMGWGALAILKELASSSSIRPVRLIFQPEEETSRGGLHMIKAGALDGVSAAIALHVDPQRPTGTIGTRDGILTAGCDIFECTFQGRGGHGARPNLTSDTVGAAAQWITDIYRRVPRVNDARDAVVVNVGQINAGTASNIVPETASLTGTIRTLSQQSSERSIELMREISAAIGNVHRCKVDLQIGRHTPPVENSTSVNAIVREAAISIVGNDGVREIQRPSMGAEDFAFMGAKVPIAMFRIGVAGIDIGHHPLHTARFDIDEAALPIGAAILAFSAINAPTGRDQA